MIVNELPTPKASVLNDPKWGGYICIFENETAVITYIMDGDKSVQITNIMQCTDPVDNIRDRRYMQQILSPKAIIVLANALNAFIADPKFLEAYKEQKENEIVA